MTASRYETRRRYALHGADVTMPDLLHLIAKCERHGQHGDA